MTAALTWPYLNSNHQQYSHCINSLAQTNIVPVMYVHMKNYERPVMKVVFILTGEYLRLACKASASLAKTPIYT